jgi:hypothetical protein
VSPVQFAWHSVGFAAQFAQRSSSKKMSAIDTINAITRHCGVALTPVTSTQRRDKRSNRASGCGGWND